MTDLQKARYFLAKYQALSNAAEFIRSHGEEGFRFEDADFCKSYFKETENTAKQLQERADVFAKKYEQMNIDINSEIDMDY